TVAATDATTAAGAVMRRTVRLTVEGTNVARSVPAQHAHNPRLATSCTGRLASASASPSAGPHTSGSRSHAIRTGHAPARGRWPGIPVCGEVARGMFTGWRDLPMPPAGGYSRQGYRPVGGYRAGDRGAVGGRNHEA